MTDRPAPSRRRRLRLSVRAMLGLIVVVAVGLGWWANSARRQQAAVAAIRAYTPQAYVAYDDGYRMNELGTLVGSSNAPPDPWDPIAWLERRLGRDYFHTVVQVGFGAGQRSSPAHRDAAVAATARLRGLRRLFLGMDVADADLAHLQHHGHLTELVIAAPSPRLTDAGLRTVGRLSNLEVLEVRDAAITDAGVAALATLTRLRTLRLGSLLAEFGPGCGLVRVDGRGFGALANLPDLAEVCILSPALDGAGLKQLGRLRPLLDLRVGGTFGDEDLRGLASLTNLMALRVSWTDLDGTGFRHLTGLPNLGMVDLAHSTIGDAAVPFLTRLPGVSRAFFYDTNVSKSGVATLRALPRMINTATNPAMPGEPKRL